MALEHRIIKLEDKYYIQRRQVTKWLKRVVVDWYSLGDIYNSWGDMKTDGFVSLKDVKNTLSLKREPFFGIKVGEMIPVVEVVSVI